MSMTRIIACACLVFTVALASIRPVGATEPAGRATLEADLQLALREEQAPGIVWTIVDQGQQRTGAAGYGNAKTAMRLEPGHKVHVGSVAKTVIALGVLQLVTEGRLKLDTKVEHILPDIRLQNRWGPGRPVLVRHLLDHTSGLEDARIWQVFSSSNTASMPLIEVFSRDPTVLRLRTPPGETFSYSNMGYTLAAMIIERITGEHYEAHLEKSLLRPLGMRDSTLYFTTQIGSHRDPRLAWGHLGNGDLAAAIPMAVRPAGQFTTTAADMGRLAQFLMSDGRVGGKLLVDPALLRRMGQPDGTLARQAGLLAGYGLGLAMRDREGRVGYCHQGDTVGYHALLCIYPTSRKAFFLALNRDGDGLDTKRFHRLLIGATAPAAASLPAAVNPRTDYSDWLGRYQPVASRFAIERYSELLGGGAELRVGEDGLEFRRSGRDPDKLVPVSDRQFRSDGRVGPSHILFEHNGERLISDGERSFRKVTSARSMLLWISLGLGLAGFVWFLVATPALAAVRRRTFLQPVAIVMLACVPAGYLLYRLPFTQWGDLNWATGLLAALSVAIPAALVGQIGMAVRSRPRLWQVDLLAGLLALQWVAVLAWFGLVPLRLWA